jgi:hypothetical protein
MSTAKNLRAAIDANHTLNAFQRADLFAMVAKGCRVKTQDALASRLALPLSLWPGHARFERVHLEADGASYCAGQSYPDEIRELRELILKG